MQAKDPLSKPEKKRGSGGQRYSIELIDSRVDTTTEPGTPSDTKKGQATLQLW